MTSRLVRPLLVLVLLVCGARSASAAVTVNPNPVAEGSTPVGTPATKPFVVAESSMGVTDTLDIDVGAPACAGFSVNPTQVTVSMGSSQTVTATYNPTTRGAATCPAQLKNHANGNLVLAFNLTGTGTGPALQVAPGTNVTFSPTRVTTGAISTQLITLTNNGEAALTITAINFGTGTDFSETTGPTVPLTLMPGNNTAVTVQFKPLAPGTRTDTLTVASNATGAPSTVINLSGQGTNAAIAVADVAFGTVTSGQTTVGSISISNTGPAPIGALSVTSATLADTSGWFTFDATTGCGSGGTCTFGTPLTVNALPVPFKVDCTPTPATSTASQTATVTFTSDTDPPGTSNVATLSCTGSRSDISLVPPTATLAFGNVPVATSSAVMSFDVHNAGGGALTYTTAITGAGYTITTGACATACTIAGGGADKIISVKFTPTVIGAVPGTLTITDNDPDPGDSPLTITLSGTGTASQIGGGAPGTLAFGNVDLGKSSAQVLAVTNTGNADLNISSAVLAGAGSAIFTVTDGSAGAQALPAGMAATWTIACTPTVTTIKTATFTITSDSLANKSAVVTLSCTGQNGVLAISPGSGDFGAVREGDSATLSFTVSNTGNAQVSGITAALANTTLGYSIVTPPPATLAGGGSGPMSVKFNPTSPASGGMDSILISGVWGSAPTTMTQVTLPLAGSDAAVGLGVSTTAIAFGDLNWNTTATQMFQITLADSETVNIQQIDLAPNATTASNELTTTIVSSTVGKTTLPITLTKAGDSITVAVKCAPMNYVGPLGATITVQSDLLVNPTRTVAVTANSVSPALALTPANGTLDFGKVDVDGSPQTAMITLMNSGSGALSLGPIVTSITPQGSGSGSGSGSAGPVFTFSLPTSPGTIAPHGSATIQVTYSPVLEESDAAVIVVPLSGIFGTADGNLMINVIGVGINRHIAVAQTAITFPPTFRYPTTPPTLPVHVTNTGQADLHVKMVDISGSTVFTIADTSIQTIAGGASHDFIVTFDPLAAGPVAQGVLELENDDTPKGQPDAVAHITLDGTAIDRDVAMGPSVIDLGVVGIGIPRKLTDLMPDGVQVISMDPTNTFHIHAITTDDAAHITLLHAPEDVDLAPSATDSFDIEFAPSDVGAFSATLSLYLDDDPDPRANVTVNGTGVFVEAHGGGGCDAGGRGGGAGGLVLVAGALVAAGRKRRRVAVAAAAALASGSVSALADPPAPSRDLDASVFHPMTSTGGSLFGVQSAAVGASGDFAVSALVSYADKPLDLATGTTDDYAIASRTLIDLGGAYAFLGDYEVAAHMPLYMQSGDGQMDSATGVSEAPAKGTARGDLRINGKGRFWRSAGGELQLGAALSLTLPTATADEFAGVSKPEVGVLGLLTYAPDAVGKRLVLHVNGGGVLRQRTVYANIDDKSGLAWGAGAAFRTLDALWLEAEAYGQFIPGGVRTGPPDMTGNTPSGALDTMEFLVGARYQIERRTSIGLALGRGLDDAFGTPELRGVFSMTFVSGQRELPPIHPPPPPKIDGDADGDGVKDSVDKCPTEAEDKDGFEDEDGCPDPDNDKDGIPDAKDKCPDSAEDKDGFQDEDGCPDLDNDRDGILDAKDKCPNDPEDKDGFQDGDGCPDPDNDKDGILDTKDKCPNQPETINGVEDEDGCPDKGDSLVVVSPDRLDLLDTVKFIGPKINKASFNVLGQVGATLRAHDEILRVRVTVHVQPTGNAAADKELTERRAKEVRDWLVTWGIAAKRLEAKGFGGTKPIMAPNKKGAAALNERLELIILEKK